jgi:hypothetical protein
MDTHVRVMEAAEGTGHCGGFGATRLAGCTRVRRSRAAQSAGSAMAAAVEAGGVPKRWPVVACGGEAARAHVCATRANGEDRSGSELVTTWLAELARARVCAARAELGRHGSRMTLAGRPEQERGEAAGEPRRLVGYGSLRVWSGRVRVNGSGPIEIRNGFLNLDNGFPILQNRK